MRNFGLKISNFRVKAGMRDCVRQSTAYNQEAPGFTLLEVMVAVTIMGMVLVILLGLKNSSMKDVALAEHITVATMLAKRTMVGVTASKPSLPSEDEGEFPEADYAGYKWKTTISPTPLAQFMEVSVAVLWKEGTRDESVELVSYE
jgi:general secretion pathway protein I